MKLCVEFSWFFEPAWVFAGLFALLALLLDGKILVWGLLLYIESLEEALEVEVLEVVRTEREFSDYEFDVLCLKLQFLEHFDQIFLTDCLVSVFDVFERNFQLIGVAAGRLSYRQNHFLLLTLLKKQEVIDHFSEYAYQGRFLEGICLTDLLSFVAVA